MEGRCEYKCPLLCYAMIVSSVRLFLASSILVQCASLPRWIPSTAIVAILLSTVALDKFVLWNASLRYKACFEICTRDDDMCSQEDIGAYPYA